MPTPLSESDRDQIHAEIIAGRMIQAIKIYRNATGEGLKEAKDAIEAMASELRENSPERFAAQASKSGCMTMVVLLVSVATTIAVVWHNLA